MYFIFVGLLLILLLKNLQLSIFQVISKDSGTLLKQNNPTSPVVGG